MLTYKEIDELIVKGQEKLWNESSEKDACDLWLDAWEGIKQIMEEESLADITEVGERYDWTEFIENYVQDLEMELHNAGIDDGAYFEKRIAFCEELLKRCPSDSNMRNNTRRAIADSYVSLGRFEEAEDAFESLTNDEPNWSWGYVGWADYYVDNKKPPCYERAAEILDKGLQQLSLAGDRDLCERAEIYFSHMSDDEKRTPYGKKLKRLAETMKVELDQVSHQEKKPTVKAEKVGRNDPCLCGSGKKYKKCCL